MNDHGPGDEQLGEVLRQQLQAAVSGERPSDRLRATVLAMEVGEPGAKFAPPRRRRRVSVVAAAAVGVATFGIGAAAATGLLDRPSPEDAAAIEELPDEATRSAHVFGWRVSLSSEAVHCSFGASHDDVATFASSTSLFEPLTAGDVTAVCLDADVAVPAGARPRVCATSEPSGDPAEARAEADDHVLAVVVDSRACEDAGFVDTDVTELLAVVNDRRAREVSFLANFSTGTCLAADEAVAIGKHHLAELGDDFQLDLGRGDPGSTCFSPAVSWVGRKVELYPTHGQAADGSPPPNP